MTFRVTQFAIQNQAIQYATLHNADLFRAQEQITSGLRFTRPSEEPFAFRQVSSLNNEFSRVNVELETIRSTEAVLNTSVSQLTSANNLITAATSAVLQGIQSIDPANNEALALEVDGILNQLKTLANSVFNNEYLYAGTKTGQPPFQFTDPLSPGRSIGVEYVGSETPSEVRIGDNFFLTNYYNGLEIFGDTIEGRDQTIIYSNTGASIGSGTDTLPSRATLDVFNGTTTYDSNTGISAGLSAADGDTIIGDQEITVIDTSGNGSSGTISLNGGEPVPFTDSDTDLEVTDTQGRKVYLNTTSISPGFNGTETISAGGFISLDGGDSLITIDFSSSQVVTDPLTGGFVTINTRNINQAGQDYFEFPGSSDAFQVLYNVAEDLRNVRNLSAVDATKALNDRLGELESLRETFLSAIGEQSTSLKTLEGVALRKEQLALQYQNDASELQATDFTEATLQLSNSRSLLEYSFAVTAQISSLNILDFLR